MLAAVFIVVSNGTRLAFPLTFAKYLANSEIQAGNVGEQLEMYFFLSRTFSVQHSFLKLLCLIKYAILLMYFRVKWGESSKGFC